MRVQIAMCGKVQRTEGGVAQIGDGCRACGWGGRRTDGFRLGGSLMPRKNLVGFVQREWRRARAPIPAGRGRRKRLRSGLRQMSR